MGWLPLSEGCLIAPIYNTAKAGDRRKSVVRRLEGVCRPAKPAIRIYELRSILKNDTALASAVACPQANGPTSS
jgi:hypothetical protein